MKITARELESIIFDFTEYYLRSPAMSEVHFGCECGCGGDSYTAEQWDELHDDGDKAKEKFEKFCEDHNIEWDYD